MEYFYLYILKCWDDSYYVGHTDNIERRFAEHQQGIATSYTKDKLPVELVYVELFASRSEVLLVEHKIKRWTRKKKEALIKNDWNLLQKLSKKSFE